MNQKRKNVCLIKGYRKKGRITTLLVETPQSEGLHLLSESQIALKNLKCNLEYQLIPESSATSQTICPFVYNRSNHDHLWLAHKTGSLILQQTRRFFSRPPTSRATYLEAEAATSINWRQWMMSQNQWSVPVSLIRCC